MVECIEQRAYHKRPTWENCPCATIMSRSQCPATIKTIFLFYFNLFTSWALVSREYGEIPHFHWQLEPPYQNVWFKLKPNCLQVVVPSASILENLKMCWSGYKSSGWVVAAAAAPAPLFLHKQRLPEGHSSDPQMFFSSTLKWALRWSLNITIPGWLKHAIPPFFYIYGNWHPCLLGTVKLLMCTFNRQQASTKPYSSASSALPQFLKLSNIIASKGQKFTSHVENSFCKALPPFLDSFDNLPEPLWGWPGKYDCWIVSQSMSSGYEQLILKLIWNVRFLFPLFFLLWFIAEEDPYKLG